MIHIVICDDSAEFQATFSDALKKNCAEIFPKTLRYEIIESFSRARQVLEYAEKDPIDILFLDIDMPDMSGLELAKRLVCKKEDTVIVFVSGYDHYVYEVFEFSPFAFLRKDRIGIELPQTLKRIADKFDRVNYDVTLNTVSGAFTVCARDVLYICSKGNYYTCCMKNGKELSCRGTLADAEKLFFPFDFSRVHSAYLINLHQIQKIEKNTVYVGMDMARIPIAQRRQAAFKQAYAQFTMRDLHI